LATFLGDASYFARRPIVESKAWVAGISRKTNDDSHDSRFQIITAGTWALPGGSEVHYCACFHSRVCHYKKRTSGQTKFLVSDVCKMMSVPAEGAERLAEIFREMLALSETSRSNQSQSAVADDSIESVETESLVRFHRASADKMQAKSAGSTPGQRKPSGNQSKR